MDENQKPVEIGKIKSKASQEAETKVSRFSKIPKATKILILFSALSVILCFLIIGGFLGFGHIKSSTGCTFKGIFVDQSKCDVDYEKYPDDQKEPTTEVKKPEVAKGFKLYEVETYSLQYPENWLVEKGTSTYFFSQNPKKLVLKVNDNFNVFPQKLTATDISNIECKAYSDSVFKNLQKRFEKIKMLSTMLIELNGKRACRIKFQSRLKGIDMVQTQYLVVNPEQGKDSFILTATAGVNSDNIKKLDQIANSFEIKN